MARRKKSVIRRKLRTREHVIAELSLNFLERKVLQRRHQLHRMPAPEYGIDAWMFHFSPEGHTESGHVFFQLKATDNVRFVDSDRSVIVRVETAHLRDWWYTKHHPVILVLYDARKDRAFWLDIQQHCDELNETNPSKLELDAETITLRMPNKNRLTLRAVDQFRLLSLSRMN